MRSFFTKALGPLVRFALSTFVPSTSYRFTFVANAIEDIIDIKMNIFFIVYYNPYLNECNPIDVLSHKLCFYLHHQYNTTDYFLQLWKEDSFNMKFAISEIFL